MSDRTCTNSVQIFDVIRLGALWNDLRTNSNQGMPSKYRHIFKIRNFFIFKTSITQNRNLLNFGQMPHVS